MRYSIGVDPGLQGAVAMMGLGCELLYVADMPVIADTAVRQKINVIVLRRTLERWTAGIAPEFIDVFVERVHAMPRQGISSAFVFGRGYGRTESVFELMGFKVNYVQPEMWKKHYGLLRPRQTKAKAAIPPLTKEQLKAMSTAKAKTLFPGAPLNLVKHHGRAEAMLIAKYGQELLA